MQNSLQEVLENGYSITYKNFLSIDPVNLRSTPKRIGYQVICNKKFLEFGAFYKTNELEVAVDKFIMLKNASLGK